MSANTLEKLASTIAARAGADPASSYTAKLLAAGAAKCARKFGEESVELVIAAIEKDKRQITAEASDVLYHLLVLLQSAGIPYTDVLVELERRESQGGLQEKASRGVKD